MMKMICLIYSDESSFIMSKTEPEIFLLSGVFGAVQTDNRILT